MTTTASPLILRGPTVTLRPLVEGDAGVLAATASESREPYGYTRVPDGVEDAQRYIELALAEGHAAGRRLAFAIVWRDRLVGSTRYLEIGRWRPAGSPLPRTDHPDVVDITPCRATTAPIAR